MKTLALFLVLCFLLPSPAYSLRGSMEGIQAGIEEKLRADPQSLDPNMGRVLFGRVDRILSGRSPESEFLWPVEARLLHAFHYGVTFWLKRGKGHSKLTPRLYRRYRWIQQAIEAAEKRAAAYADGVRTLETLPRQARLMLVYGSVGAVKGSLSRHPAVDEKFLEMFSQKRWDPVSRSIPPETRSVLQKGFQNAVTTAILFLLEDQKPGGKGIEGLFDKALDDIEAVLRSRKYAGLRKKQGVERTGRANSETGQMEQLLRLRQRWREISVEMMDKLIRFAPRGEWQEIGPGTPISISDQIGKKEKRIREGGGGATLRRLRARLAGDPKGILVERLRSGHFLFRILNQGFGKNSLLPGGRGKTIRGLEKAIGSVELFLEEHRYAHLFPLAAGAEELTQKVATGLEARVLAMAVKANADRVFLVPLGEVGGGAITLRPFLYGSMENRKIVEEYLAEAGPLLAEAGFQMAPLKEGLPELSDDLAFVVYQGDIPSSVRAATFPAAQLSARSPNLLHPLLVAARVLHPTLSLDFLSRYQVKGLAVVEDQATGARYLAVLA